MTDLAFAGAGHITIAHALAAEAIPGLRITRVASRTTASAEARARQVGASVCTYDELPAGADAVVVATPPGRHAQDGLRALEAGAAVLLEKPMATTLAEADALVDADGAAGHRLVYGENLAFAPVIELALAQVRTIGPLRHLEVRALQERPTWGDFLTTAWGGGVLFDLGVHPLAVAMLLAGPATVVAVSARLEGAADIPVDEHAEVELHLDTGLVAQVAASWRAPSRVWDLQAASDAGVVRAELTPALLLERDGEPVVLPEPSPILSSPQLEQFGYVAQLQALVATVDGSSRPVIGSEFGREVLDVVCAAYSSAGAGGEPVAVPFAGPRDRTPLELWQG